MFPSFSGSLRPGRDNSATRNLNSSPSNVFAEPVLHRLDPFLNRYFPGNHQQCHCPVGGGFPSKGDC